MNKRAFKRSFLAAFSRLIGVGLGAGAGSLIHQMVGDGFTGWGIAAGLAAASFGLMLFAEYEKEKI